MPEMADKSGAWSITLIGSCVNIVLIGLKLIAGIIGHSQALIADAVHSLSDLFTDLVVFYGLWRGRKPPDKEHHFGHGRIETLATATVGLMLIGAAIYMGLRSATAILAAAPYQPTALAIVGAALSIVLKEGLYHFTLCAGRRANSQLVVANAWHHRSDALSSVAVLLGVSAASINPRLSFFDPLAALLVSFFVLKVGFTIFNNTLRELGDAAPEPAVLNRIIQCASCVEGVMDAHDLRVRSTGGRLQLEIHIVVDGRQTVTEGHRVAKKVESCLTEEVENLYQVIVHVDPAEKVPSPGGIEPEKASA